MVVKQDKVAFEDALRMAGFGKYNVQAFALCSSVIMGMSFEIFSVSYLVPGSACELHTTSTQQGLMAAVPLIGIILTSHIWGYLADLKGRRQILAISLSLAYMFATFTSFAPNWIAFSFLKLCSSAAVSGAYAMGLTLMSESTLMERRSILMLLTTTMFLLFSGLMAVISIPVLPLKFSYYIPVLNIHFNSWRLLSLIFALPCAVGAFGVYFSYESPKFLLSVGKHDEAVMVLRGIFQKNSGKSGDLYGVTSVYLDEETKAEAEGFWESIKAQTLPMIKRPLLKDTLLLSLLIMIVYISINPFFTWLPFIVDASMASVERGNVNLTLCQMIRDSRNFTTSGEKPSDCSMNTFAMTVVFSISVVLATVNLIVSGLSQWIGRKAVYIMLQVVGALAALYINFSYNWIVSAVCFMIYVSGSINFTSLTSYCVDVYPTYVKAMAVSVTLMIGRASAIVGINLVKRLLEDNCEAGFYIFGSIYLVGGLIAFLLPTDKQLMQRSEEFKTKLKNAS